MVEGGRMRSKGYMYVLVKAKEERSGREIGKLERQNSGSECRVSRMTSTRRRLNIRWVQYPLGTISAVGFGNETRVKFVVGSVTLVSLPLLLAHYQSARQPPNASDYQTCS